MLSRCLAALLAASAAQAAPEIEPYFTTSAGWVVYYHPPSGNCGMMRENQLGTAVIVNYERGDDSWTFSISNNKWDKVEAGSKYQVFVLFDEGRTFWGGIFVGSIWGRRPLLSLPNAKIDFVKEFMQHNSLAISTKSEGIAPTMVQVDGSWDGMQKVIDCQRAH
jgi:hypothetical protein